MFRASYKSYAVVLLTLPLLETLKIECFCLAVKNIFYARNSLAFCDDLVSHFYTGLVTMDEQFESGA